MSQIKIVQNESAFCIFNCQAQGATLCKKLLRDLTSQMFINLNQE